MLEDRYGLPLSTSSGAARLAYVDGVDRLLTRIRVLWERRRGYEGLSANAGAEKSFDGAGAADPGFALAHIGRARVLHLEARGREAQATAREARSLAAGASDRERGHVEALALAGFVTSAG